MQYFTGAFQGNIPILSNNIKDAEVIENEGDAISICKLLNCLYGGRPWQWQTDHEEDLNFNFIVCR